MRKKEKKQERRRFTVPDDFIAPQMNSRNFACHIDEETNLAIFGESKRWKE